MKRRKLIAGIPEVPSLPEGFAWGKDIPVSALSGGRIAVTPEGNHTAFLGYLSKNSSGDFSMYPLPRRDEIERHIRNTVLELRGGGLFMNRFLSDNQAFRILEDRRVCLPHAADNYFGVLSDTGSLDEPLTREFFGATMQELEGFLTVFHAAVRYPVAHFKPFRVTFSKTRDNDCDLTRAYIPQEFPFIACGDTQFFGGHVSLNGFYRHLNFLCEYHLVNNEVKGEGFFNLLVQHGAKPELIMQLCEAASLSCGHPLIDPAHFRQLMDI